MTALVDDHSAPAYIIDTLGPASRKVELIVNCLNVVVDKGLNIFITPEYPALAVFCILAPADRSINVVGVEPATPALFHKIV